ncbi:IS1634 family transposase [Zhenpiania hominis]|uniref:IS1634 family transposase n=1 Tax=Zhenpiania hominis TaxID=2763644 RepID=A0A923NQ39_9FIRM|nr:IS1634 family transposase [Zhenpiania hominis]MBC6681019.1 IS1634 family transposase [Zhenpiania hominis]
MRLGWTTGKYSITYRAVKTVRVNGKNKTQIVRSFGSEKHICETYGVTDAKAWAKEQVRLMNEAEKEDSAKFHMEFCAGTDLVMNQQRRFNGGYLFLQDIYYELGLHKICRAISRRHLFEYDLNQILSRLIYTGILYPSSKRSSFHESKRFLEQPSFELHDIYRALSVIAEESDYIQSRLFQNTTALQKRNTQVIYYDCTNFYFEVDAARDDKQFGKSKENRPLPIVGMGLFMDMDGIPISFSIFPGNRNEQRTMIPLEKKMLSEFDLSKFVVCTDAGLSSATNRVFNSYDGEDGLRGYITTQPIKTLKAFLQKWCLADDGWFLDGDPSGKTYRLSELDGETDKDKIFYKTRWIREEGLVHTDKGDKKEIIEQKLIVSYSIKYSTFQRHVREGQLERAKKLVEDGYTSSGRKKQNDPKRFIKTDHATKDGEVAELSSSYIDESVIREEEKYDGFYAVCTNLDESVSNIVKANRRRWEIEECFRIMKTDFEARPVYLNRQERILAHFITCFLSLIVYRYLEKKLDQKYTIDQILPTLQEMDFMKYEGKGYQPVYTRTELTDALHDAFGFCTSKQIVPIAKMRNICSQTKK